MIDGIIPVRLKSAATQTKPNRPGLNTGEPNRGLGFRTYALVTRKQDFEIASLRR
jgi:hypothetical protein